VFSLIPGQDRIFEPTFYLYPMPTELQLHLVLQAPPPGIDFGVQKGSGNTYETVLTQRSADQDLHFSFSIMVKGDPAKDEQPDFSGPYVQGKRLERFFYIDVGN
jgi:hypothetical protein